VARVRAGFSVIWRGDEIYATTIEDVQQAINLIHDKAIIHMRLPFPIGGPVRTGYMVRNIVRDDATVVGLQVFGTVTGLAHYTSFQEAKHHFMRRALELYWRELPGAIGALWNERD